MENTDFFFYTSLKGMEEHGVCCCACGCRRNFQFIQPSLKWWWWLIQAAQSSLCSSPWREILLDRSCMCFFIWNPTVKDAHRFILQWNTTWLSEAHDHDQSLPKTTGHRYVVFTSSPVIWYLLRFWLSNILGGGAFNYSIHSVFVLWDF